MEADLSDDQMYDVARAARVDASIKVRQLSNMHRTGFSKVEIQHPAIEGFGLLSNDPQRHTMVFGSYRSLQD